MPHGYLYIMANHKTGTLYVGSTTDIQSRVFEHKSKANPNSFTAKYDCDRLVYLEHYDDIGEARARERAVKRYKRQWKIEMIEAKNPEWQDIPLQWDD
ncbi:excinuclease ABC subunit C [Algimonas arctica]|uniref:Excinuclease ABC subunit C n=1 Tax=Algimonas arctica TaxID=1479486 RepID=A0A8J3CV59_9PROT|nr:GIY-YIG nuclease family protein [Algimonas arctica]GHB04488.1 excinuclease ABC subunit C [Algimonas arctica]